MAQSYIAHARSSRRCSESLSRMPGADRVALLDYAYCAVIEYRSASTTPHPPSAPSPLTRGEGSRSALPLESLLPATSGALALSHVVSHEPAMLRAVLQRRRASRMCWRAVRRVRRHALDALWRRSSIC